MSNSPHSDDPDSIPVAKPDNDAGAPPPGPTRYDDVPILRRNGFCSGVLIAHVIVMFLSCCVPFVSLFGIFTTIGVIVVCCVVLTGPVYYNKHRKDGTLAIWSRGNKVAAVILLLIFVGSYGGLVYWLISNSKFG